MKKVLDVLKKREALLGLIIILFSLFVTIRVPLFLSYENLSNVLKSCSVTGIFALGVLVVIISGGFDVSFTAIAQVSEYLGIWLLMHTFIGKIGNLFVAFVLVVLIGGVLGLLNGYLIDHFKLPAIIITISTQNLFYGIMYVVCHGRLIYTIPDYIWPLSDKKIFQAMSANGATYGISMVTVLWMAMAIILAIMLKKTIVGRSVYWIGGNPLAAERVGINMKKMTLFVYGLTGVIAGIGALAHIAVVQTVIPNSIVGTEMSVIAAVVLGGASITGGKGSVLGSILGVLLFAIVNNSLTLLQISSYWYNVFTGAIIILSIVLNAVQESQQRKRIIRVKVADTLEGVAV